MQNFSPEHVMEKLRELEDAISCHVPVGEGTETALEKRVNNIGDMMEHLSDVLAKLEATQQEIDLRVSHLENNVVSAGAGAVLESGAAAPDLHTQTIDPKTVGEFTQPAHAEAQQEPVHDGQASDAQHT